jgi:probable rRNA maturation factor
MPVDVFKENTAYGNPEDETKRIVEYVLSTEGRDAEIGVVFVNKEKILELNKIFLKHDYVTDVISFPIEEIDGIIEGEVYVCIDQAMRQAEEYGVSLDREVARLVIHGVLHLLGYNDTTTEQKRMMKEKEDLYIDRLKGSELNARKNC